MHPRPQSEPRPGYPLGPERSPDEIHSLTIRRRAKMVQDHSVSNRDFSDEAPGIGDGPQSCETILSHEAALGIDVGNARARAGPVAGALDGAFGSRNRGHVADAGIAGWGAGVGARRQ